MSTECANDTFACSSGLGCISTTSVCDGVLDCVDMSDEFGCGKNKEILYLPSPLSKKYPGFDFI